MVQIEFMDGDSINLELMQGARSLDYEADKQCFCLETIEGIVIVPREFIKYMRVY